MFDPQDQPIMVILNENDKKQIAANGTKSMKYFAGPADMKKKQVTQFMDVKGVPIVPFSSFIWKRK
jgi:hypothetical protein